MRMRQSRRRIVGVQRGYNEGKMYPNSLLSPKEKGKWIKIYV